jgi:hypothetical protein
MCLPNQTDDEQTTVIRRAEALPRNRKHAASYGRIEETPIRKWSARKETQNLQGDQQKKQKFL